MIETTNKKVAIMEKRLIGSLEDIVEVIGFLGIKDVWNELFSIIYFSRKPYLNKWPTLHDYDSWRSARPTATANSGPLISNIGARKAGASVFEKGLL